MTAPGLAFEVETSLGFTVRVTQRYWTLISKVKHPVMAGRQPDVEAALREPETVRRSRSDKAVYLFYRPEREGRWTCAVVRRRDGTGFLITAYPTDAIKEGAPLWPA